MYIRHGKKPTDEDYDRKFLLPHDLWDVDVADDRFKIFVPESQLDKTGLYYIGIRDICKFLMRKTYTHTTSYLQVFLNPGIASHV